MSLSSSPSSTPNLNGQIPLPVLKQPPLPQPQNEFNLRHFLNMLQRRALVVAGVAGIVMVFMVRSALNQSLSYQSSFRLLIEPINADNSLSNLTGDEGNGSGQANLDYDTQIQVLRSPELMAKLAEQVQAGYPGANYSFSATNLNIVRLAKTKILEVSYQDDDPAEVKAILDQALQVYLRYSLSERQTNLRQGIQFIEKQLPILQERVNSLQDELQTFRQRYNFVDPDTQSEQISSQASALEQQKQEVEQALAQARFKYSALQGETGGLAALSKSSSYQSLVGQLRQIESQIAAELTRFQPQSLTIRVLQEKKQNLLPLLRQEAAQSLGAELAGAAIEIQSLELQQAAIIEAQSRLALQTQQLPILSRNYVDLQRELQIATDSLNRFQSTRETLQIQAAQTEIPWQVIQTPPLPQFPVSSDTNRALLIAVVVSAGLGVGAAMLLEKLDSSFHTVADLKTETKLPILGVLPLCESLQDDSTNGLTKVTQWVSKKISQPKRNRRRLASSRATKINDISVSPDFTEALRVFHTNLHLVNPTHPLRSVVITSPLAGDGKSTVAFHLAQTANTMGQKVLLVDVDLRQPQLEQWLNLTEQRGLSDVVAADIPIEEAIVQPYPEANFFALTAGNIPVDPTQLLASDKMKQLMEYFDQTFDLVIYDMPSLLGLADVSLLTPQTDGLLLVVHLDKTDRIAVNQAVESLEVFRDGMLGIVANGLQHSTDALSLATYPLRKV